MKCLVRRAVLYVAYSVIMLNGLAVFSHAAQLSEPMPIVQYGIASWYGEKFHGRKTANGEVYDMFQLTAAHRFAPLGIHAIVTDLQTKRSVRVRINDRGPFIGQRILDLSYASARQLGMLQRGLTKVKIRFLLDTAPTAPIFIVQVGAYTNLANAARAQKALSVHYPQVWIAVLRQGLRVFYRVRLGVFTDREMAEETAHHTQALGYTTSVVPIPAASYMIKLPTKSL
ncbi:MAG: septal ring lytic transglycosylase RlpA family protein [bacterium]|nr:septal ring lytic transglycosylase RlpA family protein [bacterium]